MDRNTTLAFILIGAILILWFYLNSPPPPQAPQKITDTTETKTDSIADISADKDSLTELSTEEDSLKYGRFFSSGGEDRIIVIENDLVLIEFSTRGANIHKFFLKNFNNWYSAGEDEDQPVHKRSVQLINYSKGNSYDLAFVTTDGKSINTSDLTFETDTNEGYFSISENDSVVINFTLPISDGRSIVKRYIIYGNKYHMHSDIELYGMNNLISNNEFDVVWNNGIRFVEENSVDEALYSNASVYYGDEQVIVDADDPSQEIEKDFTGRVDWLGVRNKYFAAIISPLTPAGIEGAYIRGTQTQHPNAGVREYYDGRLIIPFKNRAEEKHSFNVYIGPVDYDILSQYGNRLEAIVDFGSFFGLKFIVRPIAEYILLPLFTFLHSFIPNYGFVIIVFSLIIKIVLYPLTKQSFQSMKKMQLLQPKMAEIKEKYKEDPQKMNKEMMGLYKTYGVNPAGGCFPLLLQMPIFIALWGLFQVAIDLRQQPFILWIYDLSRPDVIYDLGFKLPLFGIQQISGLALLMGITTFFQQKMSIKDPKQQALVYIMPIMLTLMFMSFPSGLNLYYFMFNVFSIAQQYYINRQHDGMELQPVKNPKKSGGFMSKMMEAAEKNAKAKQQQQRKKR
jgi:YidC/Oxa1 family membrane protein insertase